MTLTYIKKMQCPECGDPEIVAESVEVSDGRIREHVHGGRWEHRTFACGLELAYIPNSGRAATAYPCSNGKAFREKEAKRMTAKAALRTFIAHLDVDEDQRHSWGRYL